MEELEKEARRQKVVMLVVFVVIFLMIGANCGRIGYPNTKTHATRKVSPPQITMKKSVVIREYVQTYYKGRWRIKCIRLADKKVLKGYLDVTEGNEWNIQNQKDDFFFTEVGDTVFYVGDKFFMARFKR